MMQMNWNSFIGKTLHVTLNENYGLAIDESSNTPIYEIVFKTGKLSDAFDDGLLLETTREDQLIRIYIPFTSVKCIEIFNI